MRYSVLLQAATPVAHGDTVTGVDNKTNIRIFMRQGMLIDGKPARVPAISENALRSVMIRYPLADHMLDALQIGRGDLPQSVVNLLFSGGSMASGSKAPTNEIELGHAVKKLYPMIDLLGGAVDAFILPRSRLRLSAWLVAREYLPSLRLVAPELEDEAREVSAYDMLTEETRTRGTGSESAGNQMLYTYETLAAGAKLFVEMTIDPHAPPATVSALAHAVSVWDGFVGGQRRQGRGRMEIIRHNLPDAGDYLAHISEHGERMREGMIDGTLGTGRVLCA
jgi:hypothetical protein